MSNFVQIANLAGTLIGTEARITDPADDRLLARTVRANWDLQRRATIRDGEWNFASRRALLPALAGDALVGLVLYPYAYAYQLPAGSLRLLELIDDPRAEYRLEGRTVFSSLGAPLAVRYSVDVEETALWDESFSDAFAKRIAWTIGKRIAGSTYDAIAGERIYRKAIGEAKSVDARENPPLQQEESSWVEARFSGVTPQLSWPV